MVAGRLRNTHFSHIHDTGYIMNTLSYNDDRQRKTLTRINNPVSSEQRLLTKFVKNTFYVSPNFILTYIHTSKTSPVGQDIGSTCVTYISTILVDEDLEIQ